jgi:hypothetical protein
MMTEEMRNEIKKRCVGISDSSWEINGDSVKIKIYTMDRYGRGYQVAKIYTGRRDAEFIAHARTDIPALLEALDRAEKRIGAMERAIKLEDACKYCIYRKKVGTEAPCISCSHARMQSSKFVFDEERFDIERRT